MEIVALFWLLPAAVALLACALGHYARLVRRRSVTAPLVVLVAVVSLALAGLAASGRDPDVPAGEFVSGVVLAALALGAVPVLAFYAVGYAVPYWWAVGMLWVVGAIALGFYMVVGALFVADLVACPPDAYECPV